MGCCGRANWKREEVADHKFDFIDVRDYYSNTVFTRLRYVWVFVLVIKSFAVYVADIYTAITLLAFHKFNGNIYQRVENSPNNTLRVPFVYGRWIFTGCIIFSFCLLAYEAHKSRAVVRSRDISYAYTNVMANNYYSMRSYDHFCFFCQLNNSKKKKDEFAFFIFFTFKGWKRLLVADGPRQVINALTLYALAESVDFSTDLYSYYDGNYFTAMMLLTMVFTVVIFAGSAVLLILASSMYLPLICYIQGNLKSYCCHKIDKRISELVQKKKKQRLGKYAAIARAEAAGDFSHLMNKQGIIVGQKMAQPTLPKVDVDLLNDASKEHKGLPVQRTASMSSSTVNGMQAGDKGFYGMKEGDDYGSTAHLMTNQGYAGSFGHAVPGTNLSLSSGTLNPSLPPTTHNSPDAYPVHIRGLNGVQEVQRSNGQALSNVLSQMGPIGTSPNLFAQRKVGLTDRAGSVNGASAYDDQQAMNGCVSSGQPPGSAANGIGKSPLGRDLADGFGGGADGFGGGYGEAYEMQGPHSNVDNGLDSAGQAYDYSSQYGARYPDGYGHYPDPDSGAAPVDLSAYTPYDHDKEDHYLHVEHAPQGQGASVETSRVQSFAFGDVYDAYLQEPSQAQAHDSYGQASRDAHGQYAHGDPYAEANGQSNGFGGHSNGYDRANAHSQASDYTPADGYAQADYGDRYAGYQQHDGHYGYEGHAGHDHAAYHQYDGGLNGYAGHDTYAR